MSELRAAAEPLKGHLAERLRTLATLIEAGEPVAWTEDHGPDGQAPHLRLSLEVSAARLCELCAEGVA